MGALRDKGLVGLSGGWISEAYFFMKLFFTNINHGPRLKLELSMEEYCVADSIYHLSNNPKNKHNGWCNMRQDTMAELLGVSSRTILRSEKKLLDKGLIEKSGNLKRTTAKWYENVIIDNSKSDKVSHSEIAEKVTKCHPEKRQSVTNSGDKMSHYNNKDINTDNKEKTLTQIFEEKIKESDSNHKQEFISYWTEKNEGGKKER